MSGVWNDGEHEAVVNVQRSSWDSVTESDELVGRFRLVSRLPQYLGNGQNLASDLSNGPSLNDCNVDGRSRTRPIKLNVKHFRHVGAFNR